MFLVDTICTQTSAHWHPKILVKRYGSIYFVSLVEKKCSSICPEKTTENSIQMVNAPFLLIVVFGIQVICILFLFVFFLFCPIANNRHFLATGLE